MRIAVTADLHWGHGPPGDPCTRRLAEEACDSGTGALLLLGDLGTGDDFDRCLELFDRAPMPRLAVPGNHDLWTEGPSPESLRLYEEELPRRCAGHGVHYLDQGPWLSPDGRLAVVGSMNWYDYSFADPELAREFPDVEAMYRQKLFPRGRHNDGRFVKLGMPDGEFCGRLVERFRAHLANLPESVETVVAAHHHPPVRELFYPSRLATPDQRFWLAYTGNRRMEEAVLADPRIRYVLCGHTHAAMDADVAGRRCWNVGGDYGWKRMLLLETDTGECEAREYR